MMGNQYLGLSLFIMLLSFFIILNALSEFKAIKSETVITSLNLAFASSPLEKRSAPDVLQKEQVITSEEGDTLDIIEGVFETQFENFQAQKNRLGTEMFVSVPLEDFTQMMRTMSFVLNTQNEQPEEGNIIEMDMGFLSSLVSLMRSEENGVPYRMDLKIKPENGEEEDGRTQSAQLVSAWAVQIEAAGLPQQFLSVGLDPAEDLESDLVYLHFRRYQPIVLAKATSLSGEQVQEETVNE